MGGGGAAPPGDEEQDPGDPTDLFSPSQGEGSQEELGDSASARLEPSMGFVAYFLGNFSDQSVISSFSP